VSLISILIIAAFGLTNLNPSGYAATASGSGHHSHGAGNHKNNKSNTHPPLPLPPATHSIQICCAWDDKLAGGELTYKIVGGDNSAHQAVKAAMNAWTTKLNGLKLTEISSETNFADIMINFNNNNGKSSVNNLAAVKGSHRVDTVGQTMTTVSSTGLISNAVTTVSEGAFGSPFSKAQLKQIAMHEIGHALGIGHANFKGDLMSPMLNNEIGTISQCDVRAVLAANQWKLGAAGLTPEAPKVDQINC
jgi:Matrixin